MTNPSRLSPDDRGALLRATLARTPDAVLARDAATQRSATWDLGGLLRHARKHRREFHVFFGRVLAPEDLDRLSRGVLETWDRLLVELEPDGRMTYLFVQDLTDGDAGIIVAVRGHAIRSTFVAFPFEGWLARHRATIEEITERVRGTGP